MNIVIRTDSSLEIGTGHVMRCLTLAKQLRCNGADISFICRDFPGNSIYFIQQQGFKVFTLTTLNKQHNLQWTINQWDKDAAETKEILNTFNKTVDLLIVDHYGLDSKWEYEFRKSIKNIMVIDDLANRPHDCDLLLDQNYYLDMQNRYNGLVSDSCFKLLGPNNVLLRDEFLSIEVEKVNRNGSINNILIFFGGTDPTGETMKVLKAVKELNRCDIEYTVIVGVANPQRKEIQQICRQMPNVTFHCQVTNMAELMKKSDLAIGAGGSTTWERCYLGLPSIVVIVAENQKEVIHAVAEKEAVLSLGQSLDVTKEKINKGIIRLLNNREQVINIISNSSKIVNPKVIKELPVKKKILELLK